VEPDVLVGLAGVHPSINPTGTSGSTCFLLLSFLASLLMNSPVVILNGVKNPVSAPSFPWANIQLDVRLALWAELRCAQNDKASQVYSA
jgi:hypothetical protein